MTAIAVPQLLPATLRDRYLRRGWWDDCTLGHMLIHALGQRPELEFRVWSQRHPQRLSFGEVRQLALRFAAGLRARGIGAGDAVSIYVPNSLEGAIGFMGVPLVGAAVVPVAPYYGLKELRTILLRSRARILITTGHVAGGLEAIQAATAGLPALETVYVIGEGALPPGMRPFGELIADQAPGSLPPVDPDSIAAIAFTSGTTTEPKGVIHTHRSLCCEVRLHMRAMPFPQRPVLVAGPIAHASGMLSGLFLPPLRGYAIHLMDGWNAARALEAMREADLSTGSGTQYFLESIFSHPDTRPGDLARIEVVAFGGGPVAASFAEKCEALGIQGQRCYGSTEHPTITMSSLADPARKRHHTDGPVLEGCEIRIVDHDDRDVAPGEAGELLSRGPDLCAGYVDAATNEQYFTPDGWFRTGDIASQDEDGFVTITDRIKDIIVRNGVKIGAPEVEDALLRMPAVVECAVIAAPDARTGERTHAVLRLAPGAAQPGLAQIRAHMEGLGLAKQKWPESIEVVDDFPRTPMGKIKRFELRDRMRRAAAS